jgi:hypothetical protein
VLKNQNKGTYASIDNYQANVNKFFIGFLSLIISSQIHKIMTTEKLYKNYSINEILSAVKLIKNITIDDNRFFSPLTKEQKYILNTFNFELPKN